MPSTALACTLRRRFARAARLAVLVGCGVAVAGCAAGIETFRSLRGFNKNDPDPVEAPFTGNMAAASAAAYPNLASVPPPPTRATTAAERQKLTENLIADREAAQAFASASAAAPPAAAKTAAPAAASEAPAAAASTNATSTPTPANAAAPSPAPETPAVPTRVAAAAPEPAPAPAAAAGETGGSRRGATGAPDQAVPRDSELQMPQVRSLPEPDTHRPAPPPPRLRAVPSPIPGQLPPAAIASATPQPAPSVPEFVPIAPPPAPALGRTEPPRTPAATTVAMVDALDSGQLDPAQITQVASRYRERLESQPPLRAVRVIAYTAAPAPGADPLGGYHDALERAQGIAKVLAEAGIPEKMIQTEAKPALGPIAASRIEIQFLP